MSTLRFPRAVNFIGCINTVSAATYYFTTTAHSVTNLMILIHHYISEAFLSGVQIHLDNYYRKGDKKNLCLSNDFQYLFTEEANIFMIKDNST